MKNLYSKVQNVYLPLFTLSWKYTPKNQRTSRVIVYFVFSVAILLGSLGPVLHGWFINVLQNKDDKLYHAWLYILAYTALLSLQWLLTGPARVKESVIAFNISQNFLKETLHYLLLLPMEWHKGEHSGSVNNRVRRAFTSLKEFSQNGYMYLSAVIQLTTAITAMFYFAPLFAAIAILIASFAVYVNRRFDRPFISTFNECNTAENKVMATLSDCVSNIFTVRTLRAEKSIEHELFKRVASILSPFRKNVQINEVRWVTVNLLINMISFVVLLGYIYTHYEPGKTFALGGLVTLLGYVTQFTSIFFSVTELYTALVRYSADLNSIKDIHESYLKNTKTKPDLKLPREWQEIEVNQLNFAYKPNLPHHPTIPEKRATASSQRVLNVKGLKDIDFKISHGQKIGLIGESGAGKSTMLALLSGIYTPNNATYFFVDGKKMNWEAMESHTILFPQEVEIFENTVLFNITLGLPFSEEEVKAACEVACFSEVIHELKDGLNTLIYEKGGNLSGGQKQRLALARGILAATAETSKIILLDEPTSNLDAETEAKVYNNLFKKFKDKSLICSVHNLNLVERFDYVYKLMNGRIIEEGTPEKFEMPYPK